MKYKRVKGCDIFNQLSNGSENNNIYVEKGG